MVYSIKIIDTNGSPIGERMNASSEDVLKFIHKGFRIIDMHTETEITEDMVVSTLGVSDGAIAI